MPRHQPSATASPRLFVLAKTPEHFFSKEFSGVARLLLAMGEALEGFSGCGPQRLERGHSAVTSEESTATITLRD